MKKLNKACLAAGLFIMLSSCNAFAMNEGLKRKEHPTDEKDQAPDLKKIKLLSERYEILKNIKKFPLVFNPKTGVPLAPLIPEYLMQTEECQNLIGESQLQKNMKIQHAIIVPHKSSRYDRMRFSYACALVAGGDPNCEALFGHTVLITALDSTDYWLAYLALLYGVRVNRKNKYDHSPIEKAKTVEMAQLLLACGAHIDSENNPLENAAHFGSWELVKFYLDKQIVWNKVSSPFNLCLRNLSFGKNGAVYRMDVDTYLRKCKLFFLAGYRDEKGEALEGLKKEKKLPQRSCALVMKALENPTFSLNLYLYQMDSNKRNDFKQNPLYDEQKRMHDFGKNNNYTDVNIRYLQKR